MRLLALISLLLLGACVAPEGAGTGGPDAAGTTPFEQRGCRIRRVVDGDTVVIACPETGQRSLRLTGYDTPETHEPRCAAERARGRAATARLRSLVANAGSTDIRLQGTDRYGRLLGRLYLDRVDVARQMIAEGLAVPYSGGRRRDWCA